MFFELDDAEVAACALQDASGLRITFSAGLVHANARQRMEEAQWMPLELMAEGVKWPAFNHAQPLMDLASGALQLSTHLCIGRVRRGWWQAREGGALPRENENFVRQRTVPLNTQIGPAAMELELANGITLHCHVKGLWVQPLADHGNAVSAFQC